MKRTFQLILLFTFTLSISFIPSIVLASPQNDENPELDILVRQIMGGAYEKQSLNSQPFKIGDSLKAVEKKWGKSESKSTVVANYFDRHVSFYYDNSTKRETITGIHDYGPQLSGVRLNELKQKIKEIVHKDPIKEREIEGNYEVTYVANDTHHIIFIFESNFPDGKNPKLLSYMIQPK